MWSSYASAAARHAGLPPELFFLPPASPFPSHHPEAAASGMQLWQQQQGHNINYLKEPAINGVSSSIGVATCQDCGNQAKRDCSHGRCRSCSTHVKSTWVPAARRHDRQLMSPNTAVGPFISTSSAKKPRLAGASQAISHTSTSNNNTNTPRSFETNSSNQDAGFKEPLQGQVSAPAVFKCVRVTAVNDGEDEFAYRAVVRIGGHVFKGFLYDQGFEAKDGVSKYVRFAFGWRRLRRRKERCRLGQRVDRRIKIW